MFVSQPEVTGADERPEETLFTQSLVDLRKVTLFDVHAYVVQLHLFLVFPPCGFKPIDEEVGFLVVAAVLAHFQFG